MNKVVINTIINKDPLKVEHKVGPAKKAVTNLNHTKNNDEIPPLSDYDMDEEVNESTYKEQILGPAKDLIKSCALSSLPSQAKETSNKPPQPGNSSTLKYQFTNNKDATSSTETVSWGMDEYLHVQSIYAHVDLPSVLLHNHSAHPDEYLHVPPAQVGYEESSAQTSKKSSVLLSDNDMDNEVNESSCDSTQFIEGITTHNKGKAISTINSSNLGVIQVNPTLVDSVLSVQSFDIMKNQNESTTEKQNSGRAQVCPLKSIIFINPHI